jgi:hypothetical protein
VTARGRTFPRSRLLRTLLGLLCLNKGFLSLNAPEVDLGTQVLIERVIAPSSNVLNHHVDRGRPKEMAKKLSKVETC